MPKSRHRKNHKQKVQARNNRIAGEKAHAQKMQREFIMNLIKQEQEKGLFDNAPSIGPVSRPSPKAAEAMVASTSLMPPTIANPAPYRAPALARTQPLEVRRVGRPR